jgi:hypothetical protein
VDVDVEVVALAVALVSVSVLVFGVGASLQYRQLSNFWTQFWGTLPFLKPLF